MSWSIRGSYFESCNGDAICPCRTIDGVAGGRSTHGTCLGVLSWLAGVRSFMCAHEPYLNSHGTEKT